MSEEPLDIVARLNELAVAPHRVWLSNMVCEAADEIVRLRAELAEAQATAERFRQSMYATEESSAAQYERANKAERERDEAQTDHALLLDHYRQLLLDVDEARKERDEAHTLLREATSATACAVCGADILPTLDIPHCEDCVVDEDAAATYAEASERFFARLDAALGGQ